MQGLAPPEPHPGGDRAHDEVGALEQPLGGLDPEGLDERGRGGTHLRAEHPGKMARAHPAPLRQDLDGQILAQVVGKPPLQLDDCRRPGRLALHLDAELRLSSRSADEYHEPAGRGMRQLRAVVLLHKSKAEIDSRRDACGGPTVTVVHVDLVGLDGDFGALGRQPSAGRPVRRRPMPVEEAGGGESERPRTDRGRTAGPGGEPAQTGERPWVGSNPIYPGAPDDQHGVDPRAPGDQVHRGVHPDLHPAVGQGRPTVG